jgi:hypothetical protein
MSLVMPKSPILTVNSSATMQFRAAKSLKEKNSKKVVKKFKYEITVKKTNLPMNKFLSRQVSHSVSNFDGHLKNLSQSGWLRWFAERIIIVRSM